MSAPRILAALAALAASLAPAAALAQASPSPHTSATRYDAMGRVTGTISADPDTVGSGNPFVAVRNVYDAAGRLTKVESGTLSAWQSESVAPSAWSGFTVSRTAEFHYDAMGRKLRESVRDGAAGTVRTLTQYSYDNFGRLECTAVRINPAIYGALPASACTPGTQGSDGADRIGRLIYDAAGQVLQQRVGVGTADETAEASFTYDANGRRLSLSDGNGNPNAFQYDGHGRLTAAFFPTANGTGVNWGDYEAYGYDAHGNRTVFRKRDGQTILYGYDALNRMTVKDVPGTAGDVVYAYDLRGLRTYAVFLASGEGYAFGYDGFGRLAASTSTMGLVARTLTYAYDRNGNRTRITHPDGAFFDTSYDGLNRPTWLTDPLGSALANFDYGLTGELSGVGRPGATSGFQFDALGRQTSLSHYLAAGLEVLWTFTRNPASGIASVTRDNDAYAWTGHYAVSRNYTANGLNRYSAAGGASFTYDANGNLTSDGTRTFTYDIENRLVTASGGVQMGYDPLGHLAWTTGSPNFTWFLYDGDALVAEYDYSGNLVRRFVHGGDAGADDPLVWYEGAGTAAANRRNLLADHQGSIVAVSDNAGNRLAINRYDEYGIPASTNTGRFQYTGQAWLAELGMYYYKARIYSPTLGRFLQTDPIGYDDQFNLYAYVGNDPVNATDPSGLAIVTGSHIPGKEGGIAIGLSGTSTFFVALGAEEGSDGPLEGRSRADQRSAAQINRFRDGERAQFSETAEGVTLTVNRVGDRVTGTISKGGYALRFSGRFVDVPGRQAVRIVDLRFSARSLVASVRSAPTVISIYSRGGVLYIGTNRTLVVSALGRTFVNEPPGERRVNR